MTANGYGHTFPQRRSFLSTLALGVSMAVIAIIVSLAGIVLYGMNIADRKTGALLGLTEEGLRNLPDLRRVLPPALADMLDDQRDLEYRSQLDVTARLVTMTSPTEPFVGRGGARELVRPVVEVRNRGDVLVSLLSMRVTVFNEDNVPIAESNEWAATPIAAEKDWCGPLMPGATAYVIGNSTPLMEGLSPTKCRVAATITDLRVWCKAAPATAPDDAGRRSSGTHPPGTPRPPEAPHPSVPPQAKTRETGDLLAP